MNIDGFGTETVDRLLENNMIKNFSDIYYLTKEKILIRKNGRKIRNKPYRFHNKFKESTFSQSVVLFGY